MRAGNMRSQDNHRILWPYFLAPVALKVYAGATATTTTGGHCVVRVGPPRVCARVAARAEGVFVQ
jgi:hypothetical protein